MSRRSLNAGRATLCAVALCASFGAAMATDDPAFTPASGKAQELPLIRFDVTRGTTFSVTAADEKGPIAFDLQGRLWTVSRGGGRATPISDPMWEVRLPAWSPDGSWLAVQRYTDQNWHIFVLRPDGSALRQVTFGPHDHLEPTWSRDGQRLVFVSDRDDGFDLWTVHLESAKLERLATAQGDEAYPAISPDGASIAFVREQARTFSLVVRNVATGSERVLTSGRIPLYSPAFSPDGRSLAVVEERHDQRGASATRLVALYLASGATEILSQPGSDVFPGRPTWFANGDLLYAADGHIRLRSRSSSKTKTIPFTAELAVTRVPTYTRRDHRFNVREPQPVRGILRPTVSPDGRRIAFTALSDLWVREDKPEPRRLTNDAYLDVDPTWSPDGRSLAYVSDRRGSGTMDLYVRDIESGQDRRLTQTDDDLMMPAWSPDGASIAVLMNDSRDWHNATLHFVDVKSGQLRKLPQNGPSVAWFLPSQPAWSPDGETLAVTALLPTSERSRKGSNQIMLVSVDTGAVRFVNPVQDVSLHMRTKHGPVWSPDGRYLAYIQEGLLWMIGVRPDGTLDGAPIRLTTEVADSPSWTGDSQSIVYLSLGRLRRIAVADGSVEDLPLDLTWKRAAVPASRVVRAGRLYDGVKSQYRNNVDIVLDGNRIVEVVPRRASWPGREVIDWSSHTVLPGLFQMHVHHFVPNGERDGRNWLAFGITSVREPGADPYEALERRESWAAGSRIGPRLFYAGILEGSRTWYWINIPVSSAAQVELELERSVALDYDFIKTYERMDERVMKRVVEFAHAHGMHVASHEIYPAALYGADVVEHLGTRDRMPYSDRSSASERVYDDVIGILAHAGISIVPTSAGRAPSPGYLHLMNKHPEVFDLPQFRVWPERWRKAAQELYKWQQTALSNHLDLVPNQLEAIRNIARRRVRIATGTDGGTDSHGYSLILELMYFAESGLGTHAALQAATLHAAEASGVAQDLGSIEPGKLADMIAVDGDPLANLEDLYHMRGVVKDGTLFEMDTLLRSP